MFDVRNDWFVRDNPEFDEMLPVMSKEVISQNIPFEQFRQEVDYAMIADIIAIMEAHLSCFEELTADEIEYFVERIILGCYVVAMVEKGILSEE